MNKDEKASEMSVSGDDAKTARERTLSHLENLMRTATTVGAGIVLACSARAQGQRPPQVCDPLPPPVGCCESPDQFLVRGCLGYQARWVLAGKAWTLELSLWVNAQPGGYRINFEALSKDKVPVSGASVLSLKQESRKLDLVLRPVAGEKQVELELSIQCNEKRIPLFFTLETTKAPEANRPVPVKLATKPAGKK